MKRTLALVLALIMILCMVPASMLTAFARGRGVYANDILKSGESRRVALRVTNVYEGQEMIDKVFNLSFTIHYIQK